MHSLQRVTLTSLTLILGARDVLAGGCSAPIAVLNSRVGWADSGGFDTVGTPFEGKVDRAPELRFWAYRNFATANSGTQLQNNSGMEWLASPNLQMKLSEAPPTLLALYQANWMGASIHGCAFSLPDKRMVLEISFSDPDLEGKPEHRGFYAVASVDYDEKLASYDFDTIQGASGKGGNVVPIQAIPVPRVVSTGKVATGFTSVNLELAPLVSHSDKGRDAVKLIAGYRILYAAGAVPTSSDPSTYQRARDAAAPAREAGTLKPGPAAVAVPAGKPIWLVAQVVYEDPGAVLSRATSAHVGVEGSAATVVPEPAGGRSRSGSGRR